MLKTIVKNIAEQIEQGDSVLEGSFVEGTLPIPRELINLFLEKVLEKNKVLECIEVVSIEKELAQLKISITPIRIGLKKIGLTDKLIKCRVEEKFSHPDFALRLKVVEGFNFIEEKLMGVLFNSILEVDGLSFSDKTLEIALGTIQKENPYKNLMAKMTQSKILTRPNKLLYQFAVKF